jgi:hypothetical protein
LFTSRRQKSTSYFPYIMYNTKKIRTYRDVQYGKKYGFRLYNTGEILYGHIPKGDFFGPFKRFLTVLVRLNDFWQFWFVSKIFDIFGPFKRFFDIFGPRLGWPRICSNCRKHFPVLSSIFSYICMFCWSLFVLLYFFFWPLCCLFFFDVRILIAPLVSSNSS